MCGLFMAHTVEGTMHTNTNTAYQYGMWQIENTYTTMLYTEHIHMYNVFSLFCIFSNFPYFISLICAPTFIRVL